MGVRVDKAREKRPVDRVDVEQLGTRTPPPGPVRVMIPRSMRMPTSTLAPGLGSRDDPGDPQQHRLLTSVDRPIRA